MEEKLIEIKRIVNACGGEIEGYSEANPPILEAEKMELNEDGVTRFADDELRNEFFLWEELDEDELDIVLDFLEYNGYR